MKKNLLFLIFTIIICTNASANTCTTTEGSYYACKPGYYLNGDDCQNCPEWSGVFTNSARTTKAKGTSADNNSGGITTCYIPTGTYYDSTGTFNLTANCKYTQ